MIDLHCHLLPGVDDGAEHLEAALDLARQAVADGIQVAALTPHVHPGRYANRRSSLLAHFEAFKTALAEAGIPLAVHLAGEVRLGMETLEMALEDDIPFLGTVDGYRIMLLEFPHQTIPVGSQQFIDRLIQLKIRPLIAHPERNKAIMAQPDRVVPMLDAGCWLQLTAGSLAGQFGSGALATARTLLQNGWAHVIATDAHNLTHRPPVLSAGRDAAIALVGEARTREMVQTRPAQILGLV